MDPLGKYLVQKIHLQPTIFYVGVKGTNSQFPLLTRASNSVDMAWHHLGSFRAWDMVVGLGHGSGISATFGNKLGIEVEFLYRFMDVVFEPGNYNSR